MIVIHAAYIHALYILHDLDHQEEKKENDDDDRVCNYGTACKLVGRVHGRSLTRPQTLTSSMISRKFYHPRQQGRRETTVSPAWDPLKTSAIAMGPVVH